MKFEVNIKLNRKSSQLLYKITFNTIISLLTFYNDSRNRKSLMALFLFSLFYLTMSDCSNFLFHSLTQPHTRMKGNSLYFFVVVVF